MASENKAWKCNLSKTKKFQKQLHFNDPKRLNFCDQILQVVAILDKLKILIFILILVFLTYYSLKYSTRLWLSNNNKFSNFLKKLQWLEKLVQWIKNRTLTWLLCSGSRLKK